MTHTSVGKTLAFYIPCTVTHPFTPFHTQAVCLSNCVGKTSSPSEWWLVGTEPAGTRKTVRMHGGATISLQDVKEIYNSVSAGSLRVTISAGSLYIWTLPRDTPGDLRDIHMVTSANENGKNNYYVTSSMSTFECDPHIMPKQGPRLINPLFQIISSHAVMHVAIKFHFTTCQSAYITSE